MAPKDKHFSNSMALSNHVALVVITDSVGYKQGMKMILEEIGVEVPPVTAQYLICRNDRSMYDQVYHQHLDVKNHHYATKKVMTVKTFLNLSSFVEMASDASPI